MKVVGRLEFELAYFKAAVQYISHYNIAILSQRVLISQRLKVRLLIQTQVLRGSLNKFPDFYRMDTFIDSTHTIPLSWLYIRIVFIWVSNTFSFFLQTV